MYGINLSIFNSLYFLAIRSKGLLYTIEHVDITHIVNYIKEHYNLKNVINSDRI